jgi:hypothetical protein
LKNAVWKNGKGGDVKKVCLLVIAFMVAMAAAAFAEHPCAYHGGFWKKGSPEEIIQAAEKSIGDGQIGAAKCILEGYVASYPDWAHLLVTELTDDFYMQYFDNSKFSLQNFGRYVSLVATYKEPEFWVMEGNDSTFAVFVPLSDGYSIVCILNDDGAKHPAMQWKVSWDVAYRGYQGYWPDSIAKSIRQDQADLVRMKLLDKYLQPGDSSAYYVFLSDIVDLPEGYLDPLSSNAILGPAKFLHHEAHVAPPTEMQKRQFTQITGTKLNVSKDWRGWRFFYFEGSRTIHALPTEKAFAKPSSTP